MIRSLKTMATLLFVGLAAIGLPGLVASCQKANHEAQSPSRKVIYHCPMHPTYLSDKPGTCPICGMKLVPAGAQEGHSPKGSANDESRKERKILYYQDAMNPSHTSDKPGKAPDGMDLVPVYESQDNGNAVKIDPAMIQSMGVQTEKASIRTLTRDVRTSATVAPDERRITTITSKIMGYVEKLHVNYTGQRVKKGQPLYDLYSPDLVSAQSEYLLAYRNPAAGDVSGDASGDGGQMLKSARRRLLNWDVTNAQIAELEKRGEPEKTMTVVSPAEGIVTEKMVVEGQNIEPGMKLYTVVDFSRIWVEGAIYQQDVPLVKIGQSGTVELDYYPGEQFEGKVTYIAPEMNMESATLMVRLELANTSDIKIKPGMNVTLTLYSPMRAAAVTIPDEAVIHSGLRTIVVVAKGGGFFEPREVTIGQTAGGYTEVLEGVGEGEDIVVSSQFLIDSESNLKAAIMKMTGKQGS